MPEEKLDQPTLKKWVGGVGLAAKYLYDEVPPGVEWNDPRNRLIWTPGFLVGKKDVWEDGGSARK